MAKSKIIGIEDRSYTNKDTGELKESFALYLTTPAKGDKAIGETCSVEFLTASANGDIIKQLADLGSKAIGKFCFISKNVRQFKDKAYPYIEEFEVL